MRIKIEQLEGLMRKEKKVPTRSGPIKRKDHHAPGGNVGSRVASYQAYQRPTQFQRSRMLPLVHLLEIPREGLTR